MNKVIILVACLLLAACTRSVPETRQNYIMNQPPLVPQKYIELPLGAVMPQGWLLTELEIMKNNSTGHLDEYYAKLKNDNGWLGGKGDGWEETPYWLDGALPLAYLLDDAALKEKVLRYINYTIETQRKSGFFGPVTQYERETGLKVEKGIQGDDWWPKMVMLKVMQQYFTATGDQRVISFMTRYFRYQWRNLEDCPLKQWSIWAQSRGEDNIMVVYWLYNITGDTFLLDLADILSKQTFDWTGWLAGRDWVMSTATMHSRDDRMRIHGVNVAMGLKTPTILYQSQNDPAYLESLKTGFTDLMRLHGLPMGMFSSDELLHGNDPSKGVELCAIVETMFSLENAIAITGDLTYMDALERIVFNALPTQTTDDYNMKQYFQTANQVEAKPGVYEFSLPSGLLCNCFGARSGYTCCLANMHQGWPKYVSHLWYATPDGGLAALVYGPGKVTAKIADGVAVTIDECTNYPFDNKIDFCITLAGRTTFPLELRIPGWCDEAVISLNGNTLSNEKGGQIVKLQREWQNNDTLSVLFPMKVTTSNWGRNSRAVERGPLVYALRIGEKWEMKQDPKQGDYYEVHPVTPWNYGLVHDILVDPAKNSTVIEKHPEGNYFWNPENAPLEIQVRARKSPRILEY